MSDAIPGSWAIATLAEVAKIIMGQSPPSATYSDVPVGLPFFQGKAEFGHISPIARKWCSQPGKIANKNDILLSIRAPVGPTNIADEMSCIGRGLAAIRAKKGVEQKYLLHALRFRSGDLADLATGTTFPAVTGRVVNTFEIPIPPLNEQRRIVAKIEALQERSRKAREALADVKPLLEQFRQSLLAAAFRGELTADWRAQNPNVEPASELLTRIRQERRQKWEEAELAKYEARGKRLPQHWKKKYDEAVRIDDSELPDLPEGWCWITLDEVVDSIDAGRSLVGESRPACSDEFGVLKVSAVTWGRFNAAENKVLTGAASAAEGIPYPRAGDLLISRANTPELVGAVVLVDDDYPNLILSDKILRLNLTSTDISSLYLLCALRSKVVRRVFEEGATGTSNSMRNLSQPKILAAPIPLPPYLEQLEIAHILSASEDVADSNADQCQSINHSLKLLDQSILAKAFRGELVPQDPSDEPASVLLDRIRKAREISETLKPGRKKTNGKRTAPAPDSTQLTMTAAQFVKDILILLGTWQKPVSIQLIEPALQLLHNDALRAKLLKQLSVPQKSEARAASPSQIHSKLPTVLGNLRSKGIVKPVGENHYQAADLSSVRISSAEKTKAQESIQALEALIHAQGIAEDLVATFVSEAAGGRLHVVDAV